MKPNFEILFLIVLQLFLFACRSEVQPTELAFEKIKLDKQMTLDSAGRPENTTIIKDPAEPFFRSDEPDSWSLFVGAANKQIARNKKEIDKIKLFPDLSIGAFRKATFIQTDNDALSVELLDFNEIDKEKREKFMQKVEDDLYRIAVEMDDLKLKYKTHL